MKTFNKSLLSAALVGSFGFAANAFAGPTIDLFEDPVGSTQLVSVATVGGTASNQGGAFPSLNVIGQYRDLQVTKTSDNSGDPNLGDSVLSAGFGVLQLDNATGNRSTALVTWDGNDAANTVNTTGLGGVNLEDFATSFLAQILQADLGFEYKIRLWDMDGSLSTLSAAVQFPVDLTDGATADYLFDWFNLASGDYCNGSQPATPCNPATQLSFNITRGGNLGDVDFTKIGAIQLELSNSNPLTTRVSLDLAIGKIETVPEPATLALLGLGLAGLGLSRRRSS